MVGKVLLGLLLVGHGLASAQQIAPMNPAASSSGQTATQTNPQMSTRDAAGSAAKTQQLGGVMNVAAAGFFATKCSSKNWWACYAAVQSGIAATSMFGNSRDSKGVYMAASTPDMSMMNIPDPSYDAFPGGESGFNDFMSGYVQNSNGTITSKSTGKTFDPSVFGDASKMKAAGMSDQEISDFMSTSGDINKRVAERFKEDLERLKAQAAHADANQARVVGMGLAGGGGGLRGPASLGGAGGAGFNFGNMFNMSREEKRKMVAGKSLRVGQDQLGVKMDDIFDMVHRRYQKKAEMREFIGSP